MSPLRPAALLLGLGCLFLASAARSPRASSGVAPRRAADSLSSSHWLSRLPDGETKRRFILDCTGCHQFAGRQAMPNGQPRTREEWEAAIARMLGYAGATSGFPVISAAREAAPTAEWLSRALALEPPVPRAPSAAPPRTPGVTLTEYPMPVAGDLPHDVAVDSAGSVLVTGMFTHRIYRLDPATGRLAETVIPVEKANPRAIELDARGNWWVVLGNPKSLAMYDPRADRWRTFPVGVYPHSVAVGRDGSAWFNGHFTRDPELVGRVSASTGDTTLYRIPDHPTLAAVPGGPIPYEIRVAPDGRLWGSELSGNRLFVVDPVTRAVRTYPMPEPHSGPRRFDVDARGTLWIPAYAGNALWALDPATGRFTKHPLPLLDALPYVARVDDAADVVWVGTGAADAVLRFERATGRWTTVPLTRGAMVRHLAVDRRTHDVWVAYGAAPGEVPAMVARISGRD